MHTARPVLWYRAAFIDIYIVRREESVSNVEVEAALLIVKWQFDDKVIFIHESRDHVSTEVYQQSGMREREGMKFIEKQFQH